MKTKESWTIGASKIILLLGFIGGMGYSIYLFSATTLSSKESTLLGILLTICSTLASWLVTHIYAASQTESAIEDIQERSQANLRTYALKASEKVNNLSNELNKLALYLEQELNYNEYENPKDAVSAREERIESAIHLIRTLKSVNDTSLSDWEGVIGEELEEQREEQMEKEEQLKGLIERFEMLAAHQRQELMGSQENAESLRAEVQSLKGDLRSALAQMSGSSLQIKSLRKTKKTEVEAKCPCCSAPLKFQQRASEGSSKALPCKACGKALVSRYSTEKGFQIEERTSKNEAVSCPKCQVSMTVLLDSGPFSSTTTVCKSCNCIVRVVRQLKGITVKQQGKAPVTNPEATFTEELIALVSSKLPPQPWPTGIHKTVAQELGLPQATVTRVIQELIRRGAFKPQIDGIVFEPVTPNATDTSSLAK